MVKEAYGTFTKHKDILVGVYEKGKFMPYNSKESYKAELDSSSDYKAVEIAKRGMALHGSYKDGNFRPATGKKRAGYISNITTEEGTFNFNYKGEILDKEGKIAGSIKKNGKILNAKEYKEDLEEDIKRAISSWRSQKMPALTETYEQLGQLEGELYKEIKESAEKAGIDKTKIKQYAKELSYFNKDIEARLELENKSNSGLKKMLRGGLENIATAILSFGGLGLIFSIFSKPSIISAQNVQLAPPFPNYMAYIFLVMLIGGASYFLIKKFKK